MGFSKPSPSFMGFVMCSLTIIVFVNISHLWILIPYVIFLCWTLDLFNTVSPSWSYVLAYCISSKMQYLPQVGFIYCPSLCFSRFLSWHLIWRKWSVNSRRLRIKNHQLKSIHHPGEEWTYPTNTYILDSCNIGTSYFYLLLCNTVNQTHELSHFQEVLGTPMSTSVLSPKQRLFCLSRCRWLFGN